MTPAEAESRGWNELDVVIVTGDAYVDHPSFGAAVIGRLLEKSGYRVGLISQPDISNPNSFTIFGRPRLFFAVTAGNLDSLVANYTANKKPRSSDEYSPGGNPRLRPDRATIAYTNKIRQAFKNMPIVLGGLEASMRRLAHYDYWSDKVRHSVLLDSKADILIYGMGERQILEIAMLLQSGKPVSEINCVRGTVVCSKDVSNTAGVIIIPSYEEISTDKDKFNEAARIVYEESDPHNGRIIIQPDGARLVLQNPPALPLTEAEIDEIYSLKFSYSWHPSYDKDGGVPALETVRFSITSHRGCPGGCNFCSISLHQGRIVQNRSVRSIVEEARRMTSRPDFKGTVTDIGGPTANLFGASCVKWEKEGSCKRKRCLYPNICKNLRVDTGKILNVWKELSKISSVKHVFTGSGVRYDLLLPGESDRYFRALCAGHISGYLKVAFEHTDEKVLKLMGKSAFSDYQKFVEMFNRKNREAGKKQYLVNYIISAHPGSGLEEALSMALKLKKMGIRPEQVQDFLPLPMTASAAMYYTGKDPFTGRQVYVARGERERKLQRALLQYFNPSNKKLVIEALQRLGKAPLAKFLLSR